MAERVFAVSIGEFQYKTTKSYIEDQEEHHRKKTWDEEYNEFISKYNFKMING
jgi:hypothetical protein